MGLTSSRAWRPGKSIWKLSGSRRSTAGSTASGRLVAAMTTTGVAASEGDSNPSQSERNCALSTWGAPRRGWADGQKVGEGEAGRWEVGGGGYGEGEGEGEGEREREG